MQDGQDGQTHLWENEIKHFSAPPCTALKMTLPSSHICGWQVALVLWGVWTGNCTGLELQCALV
jgi:hypothetical protein